MRDTGRCQIAVSHPVSSQFVPSQGYCYSSYEGSGASPNWSVGVRLSSARATDGRTLIPSSSMGRIVIRPVRRRQCSQHGHPGAGRMIEGRIIVTLSLLSLIVAITLRVMRPHRG